MVELALPRLAGTKDAVRELLDAQRVPERLAGQTVVVYCRNLVSGSSSYADELVRQLLGQRGAAELVLVGAPDLFQQRVARAAAHQGRPGAVHVRSAADVLA